MKQTQFWLLIVISGIAGGLIGVLFHHVLAILVAILWSVGNGESFTSTAATMPVWYRVVLPAAGGLIVGLLLYVLKAPEVAGEGVPAVRRALLEHDGRIRYRVAPLKLLATILTIGSGGSAGREGPIIQIGAAIGSGLAVWRRVTSHERRILVSAGAAAAMGATFGTPAAALLFVVEVLRQKFVLRDALAVVLATATGTLVARGVFGYEGLVFRLPPWEPVWTADGIALIGVAVVAAITALIFALTLAGVRALVVSSPVPQYLLPAIGGCVVGVIALYSPFLYEPAMYSLIKDLLMGAGPVGLFVLGLLVLKLIATSVTIGTGGSGGIFAPSLFLGALVGSGVIAGAGLLGITLSSLYVAFGMVAVFAAAAHAPLTAAFMIIEMTDSLPLLPLFLLVAYGAYGVARLITKKSLYDIDT